MVKKCVIYTTHYGKKKGVCYTLHFMVNIWTLVSVIIMLKNRLKKDIFLEIPFVVKDV